MQHNNSIKLNTLPLKLGKMIIGTEGGNSKPDIDIHKYIKYF